MKQFILFLGLLTLFVFGSCRDDDSSNSLKEHADVEYVFWDSSEEMTITLQGVKGNVVSINNKVTFLQVTSSGTDVNGYSMLQLKRISPTPADFEYGFIEVKVDDNSSVKIVILNEAELTPCSDNDGEYDSFNTGWWEQNSITYYPPSTYVSRDGKYEEKITIPLPWAKLTESNIPRELFESDDHSAARGWVMAFNLFAAEYDGKKVSKPYFSLYNKYTGVFRTFYYQFDNPGPGGEFSFLVTPTRTVSEKYPFYHSLQYAIPAGIKGATNIAIGCNENNTYQQYFTPYTIDPMLKQGWYAFDMDMSHYNPNQNKMFDAEDYLKIECTTSSTAQMTLSGCFGGTSEGTTTKKGASTTSSANGMNYNTAMTSGSSNAMDAFTCIVGGEYVKGIFKGAMALWNFGNALTGNSTDDYKKIEEATGTINQSFTGKIDLNGYVTQATSNNAKGVQFNYNAFSQSDLIGRGVWSLQETPIVYVVDDVLLGDDWGFVCDVNEGSYGYEGDPGVNNFNLFTFLDPTSLIINLNTSIYKDIRNVEMTWTYGVYPNQQVNHTALYRDGMLGINQAKPAFINKSKHKGKIYKSTTSTFANMEYMDYPVENMTFVKLDEKLECIEKAQAGSKYRYFGYAGCEKDSADADFFMVDPVVALPSEMYKFYDFEAPDYVVGVTLKFNYTQRSDEGKSDEKNRIAVFSKRFIPQVKAISKAEMLDKRMQLDKYIKSDVHQTVNGVTIKHKGASTMLERFMKTSEYIENFKK